MAISSAVLRCISIDLCYSVHYLSAGVDDMGLHEFGSECTWFDSLLLHSLRMDGDLLLPLRSTDDASIEE